MATKERKIQGFTLFLVGVILAANLFVPGASVQAQDEIPATPEPAISETGELAPPIEPAPAPEGIEPETGDVLPESDITGTVELTPTMYITSTETGEFLPDTDLATTALPQVGKYDVLELVFTASVSPSNPFDTYLLKLEVTDPSGTNFKVEGFYDGDGNGGQNGKIWKSRLSPYKTGTWSWRTVAGDAADPALENKSGQFEVVDKGLTGGLVANGKYFQWQNGGYVYPLGNFLDFANGLRTTHTFMSETTKDSQRSDILSRQRDFHTANKANIYFANKGDYDNQSVTPWVGSKDNNDKNKMDLARWKKYDQYLQTVKNNKLLAEMWFFADDSNFGGVSAAHKNRLGRYAMARTSAFSHSSYVAALEWQEDWTAQQVRDFGSFLNSKNPWKRLISVHNMTLTPWAFAGESWAKFIASQAGNDSNSTQVNDYAVSFFNKHNLPHLSEEFGILNGSSSTELRSRLWANFAGGAAGSGTGSDLKAFMRFLTQSKIPFYRMQPANNLLSGSGAKRFALAESGHHYMVYSEGGTFTLNVSGSNLKGYWFDPRNTSANLGSAFNVSAGSQSFTPPSSTSSDWVLWITDGSNLNNTSQYASTGNPIVKVTIGGSATPAPTTTPDPTGTPDPTATPDPDPSATPAPSATPDPSVTPDPSATPDPATPTPEVTETPIPPTRPVVPHDPLEDPFQLYLPVTAR